MTYFALLWKAQTIEKYRMNYEKEKMNSILQQNPDLPRTSFHQRWTHCKHKTKKCMAKTLRQYFPEGSKFSNFVVCLRTDQTFPNFVWKSVLGFVGGIVLTYLCFIFFVFQLAISLIHATIMSSVIGVLLTLGLAFSYRARCLVFLLIPQFFSRVGRYTLTCYALVLILTGPATNTLKNSEVLSESMACSQEQWKSSLRQITESAEKPFDSMKETIKIMIDRIRHIALKMKENFLKIHTLGMHIASVFHNSFSWLNSITGVCNKKLGTPYDRCNKAIEEGIKDCKAKLDASQTWSCHPFQIGHAVCETFKPLRYICAGVDYMKGPVIDTVKRKFQSYSEHISTMLFFSIHVHHSYSFSSNSSHSASQVAAGIVTEIRGKADPMLTWISWSSCVTSTFLLLIIFRAKHYQSMFETRSRFDNRYITQELRDLDLKRVRQGRETVLPLNARESAKYVTTTSFRLVASEKRYLTRSAVFTAITTFKLLIHMVADYSLYWVLMTIRYHGRYQSPWKYGPDDEAMNVLGGGAVASILRTIIEALSVPLHTPMPDPMTCLPDPYPPNFQRYAQIGVLILLLWFFALLEPYGLRLRHKIMSLYSPARAKARAGWLYNHILRTRGSFLKYARRKLHRMYKYSGNEKLTFRYWVETHIPFSYLRYFFGYRQRYPQCVLCGVTNQDDSNVELTRCETSNCPGLYCTICFNDIGQLCTICLTPVDYGDLSDVSLEKGSSESSDDDTEADSVHNRPLLVNNQDASPSFLENYDSDSPAPVNKTGSMWFSAYKAKEKLQEEIELLADYKKSKTYNESTPDMLQHELKKAMTKRLMQNKNRKPLSILTHSTNLKKNETFSFKICNNPMVYTALVSYDNPTQSNKQGFCENRVKIKEALNNLSARQHGVNMCEHTSFWLKRKKRKYSVPLKIYIQFNLLKYSRKMRTRPTRDLTAFISNFYKIKRKGIRFSIAKIYATSKIGKILRRKYKVIRRRRPKKNSLFFSLYNMFSRSKTYTKIRNDKHSGRIQEDSHDLTEIIISSPRHIADQVSLRPVSVNLRKNHERKRVQHARVELSSNKSHGAEPKNVITRNKSRGSISEYFGNNLFSPVAMLFNQTNNIPPLLKFETNYKPKEGNKNLSELFTTKRKPVLPSKVTMPNDSECMNNVTNDLVRTPENVKQGTDSIYTDSRSEHSTKSCSSKQSNFKKSILSVKKYCSNITHGQKNKSKTHSEDKCITIQPALQFTTTQDLEAGKLSHTKEETRCYCDANVGTTKETRSCSIQNTKSDDITSYTESTTTSCNSSTDTVKHESVHSRDTVTYESEDASSVQFSNYSVNKKRKPNSVQLDNKSTETASTITANATTGTSDWWSPIMERKERSTGDQVRVTTKRKPWNVAKLNLKSSLASTDTKLVSFKNKAEIIPSGIMPIRRLRSDLLKKGQRGNQLFTANSILSTNTDGTSQKPNRSVLKGARTKPTKMKRLIWQPAHR